MNPFSNPSFLTKVLASYLFDIDRVRKFNHKQLKKYQDKQFRKMVRYAYTVPVYHKKYKECGINPKDIKGIDDIGKLPFITKNDLRENYPDGITPIGFNKEKGVLVSTSGATGKPVFLYYDLFSSIKGLALFARELKAYGGSWRKSKVILIVDMEQDSSEKALFTSMSPFFKKFYSIDNIKYLDISNKAETLIKEINEFNPEFLGTYPDMLRKLALLKNCGYGKDIRPKYIFSAGAMLDSYTRKYIENAFGARILDDYGSTETGAIAFECLKGKYHVHSDCIYLEFLDKEQKPVPYGKSGNVIITKLYGKGTPVIRYTGLDDIAVPVDEHCSCGLNTQIIEKIEGRTTDSILLPDGKTISALSITGIPAKVMEDLKTYKIEQFQVIQHKIDEIEVLIVIDKKLCNVDPPVEKILDELKKKFQERIGANVKFSVNEVDEIPRADGSEKGKVVISKVKPSEKC